MIRDILLQSFNFDYPSDDLLTINFEGCEISDKHIADGAFNNSKRPLNIDLGKD
jgi:hypothetical protein